MTVELVDKPKVRKVARHSVDASQISTLQVKGPFESTLTYRQCTFIKKDGNRCKGKALKGMDKCRMHGGALAKASLKHGLFSKYVPTQLGDMYGEFLADPEIKSLRGEIALVRSLMAKFLQLCQEDVTGRKLEESDKAIRQLTESIRRLVATCSKIEDGEKYHISIDSFHVVLNQISVIICQEVKDETTRVKLAERLELLAVPSGS